MDPWSYLETPVAEQNHAKPRLHPPNDLAALTMLYDHCKVASHTLAFTRYTKPRGHFKVSSLENCF